MRRVFVRTPGGGEVTLTDGALTIALGGTEVVVNDGGDVTITSQAKVVIDAGGDVEISASGSMTLEAGTALNLKGVTVKVEGQGQAEIKAAAIALAGMTQFRSSWGREAQWPGPAVSIGCAVLLTPGAAGPPDSGFISVITQTTVTANGMPLATVGSMCQMINSVSGVPYVLPIGPGGGSSSFKIDGMALVRVLEIARRCPMTHR